MLWLVKEGASHQIIGCNIHEEKGKFQLWAEKVNGKSMKLAESNNRDEVKLVKGAIDYAIKNNDPVLELL